MLRQIVAGTIALLILVCPAVAAADPTPITLPVAQLCTPSNSVFAGVSCPTDSDCIAVGSSQNQGFHRSGLIERWNGTQWQIMAAPGLRVRRQHPVYLQDVSCASMRACVVIGERGNDSPASGSGLPISERWNGKRWQRMQFAALPGSPPVSPISVSCGSANSCTAVGSPSDRPGPAMIEHYNGRRWRVSYTTPARMHHTVLEEVSCATASMCLAVGTKNLAQPGVPDSPLVLVLTNGRWSTLPLRAPAYAGLAGVSCSTASSCVLVGEGTNAKRVPIPLAATFDGVSLEPLPASTANRLTGVACATENSCLIFGRVGARFGRHSKPGTPIAEAWDGNTLVPAFAAPHTGAGDCRPTFCLLVGSAHRLAAAYRYPLNSLADTIEDAVTAAGDLLEGRGPSRLQ
jgi:hypothetical protein